LTARPLAALLLVLCLAALTIACAGANTTIIEEPQLQAGYVIPVEHEEPDLPYESLLPEPTPAPVPEPAPQSRTVVLDPGHGGPEPGASANGVVEAQSNLDMALRVEALLAEEGIEVVLTRRDSAGASIDPTLPPIGASTPIRLDLQARVDIANASNAAVFVSIHSNGSTSAAERGVEVWFDSARPFAEENVRLANLLLTGVLRELRLAGFSVIDRGLRDGACFRMFSDRCVTLFVLGGPRQTSIAEAVRRGADPDSFASDQEFVTSRATQMPGALVELLFVSNASDAAILRNERARDAMARGIAGAILQFLGPPEQ
jgi:N-acetylmuramoyl-L-alanine amidase